MGLIVFLAMGVGLDISMRMAMGDRYRKSTRRERRWDSGFLLFIPIWGWLFVHVGHSYLDRTGPAGIWLYVMGCLFVGFLCLWGWARFVPAFVWWWLAGFVWVITLWLAVTGRFA